MLSLISSAGYSGMRLTITHTRLSAPGRVWVPSPFRPVLLSIVSDAKQLLNEYLLNYMEPATEHSHSPQVSPLQPEKRLAGLRGAVCRLSSEASETACSLHQPSEHPEADDSTWSRPGPGSPGRAHPGGPGQAHRSSGRGNPAKPPLRGPAWSQVGGRGPPTGPVLAPGVTSGSLNPRRTGGVSQCWAGRHRGDRMATFSPARQGGRGMEKIRDGLPARREGRWKRRTARGMRCPL